MKFFAHTQKEGLVDYFATEQDLADDLKNLKNLGWHEIGQTDDQEKIKQLQSNIFKGIAVEDKAGKYNFKIVEGQAVQRTEDEKTKDTPAVPDISQLDRVEAQIAYTAMMTGTLLEG